jgi:hypothetical protein
MNQEARRVQGIVRSRTEVEAEGAHERLVADDDGDGGDDGEAQRPHRPQLELLPADTHLRCTPAPTNQANERAQKITITPPRAPATKQQTAHHLDQRNYHGARQPPTKKKGSRTPRSDLPRRPCVGASDPVGSGRGRGNGGEIWARIGGSGSRAPVGSRISGQGMRRSRWSAASVLVLDGAGSVAVGEKVIRERRGGLLFLPPIGDCVLPTLPREISVEWHSKQWNR